MRRCISADLFNVLIEKHTQEKANRYKCNDICQYIGTSHTVTYPRVNVNVAI